MVDSMGSIIVHCHGVFAVQVCTSGYVHMFID